MKILLILLLSISVYAYDNYTYKQAAPYDLLLEIQKGKVKGYKQARVSGLNTSVQSNTIEYLWEGQEEYDYSVVNENINILSDSSSDTSVQIKIKGLVEEDGKWNEKEQIVTLNGTAPISAGNFIRIFGIEVVSSEYPIGQIYATTLSTIPTSASDINAKIELNTEGISRGRSLMAMYTIPSGKTGFVYRYFQSTKKSEDATCSWDARPFGEVFKTTGRLNAFQSSGQFEVGMEKLEEKTDIQISVKSASSGVSVDGSFHLIVVDNEEL